MGYQTTADNKLEDAANHVYAAVLALNEILIQECRGYDEFDDRAKGEMHEAYSALLKIRGIEVFCTYRNRTRRGV